MLCWVSTVVYSNYLIHTIYICSCSYNIEQEQKLATETTVLVESYTVSYCANKQIYT